MEERIAYLKNIKDKIISKEEIDIYEYVLVNSGYMYKFVNSEEEEIKNIIKEFFTYDKMYSRLNKKNLAYYPIKVESLKILMGKDESAVILKTNIQDDSYMEDIQKSYFEFKSKKKILKKAN